MPSLVVLGAGGFLGRNLIAGGSFPMPVRAVGRTIPPGADLRTGEVTWFIEDLLNRAALVGALKPGDIVINLAFSPDQTEPENLRLLDNVIEACLRHRVARLLHCSTAVVVGSTQEYRVDESTVCRPVTPYEHTKWALEQAVLTASSKGLDTGILRPTAILGPGGRNLLKLARSLQTGSPFANYLRACLNRRRPMHLVPVRNVTAALLHLAFLPGRLNGGVFLVSSDDDPDNNFLSIEEILSRSLGLRPRRIPLLPVPGAVLPLLLRLRGRSETNTERLYLAGKLLGTRFVPVDSVANGVREFAETLRQEVGKP
jgi:nucleoside-diphosphate-sugar epimerase